MFLLQWPSAVRSVLRPGALDVAALDGAPIDAIGELLLSAANGDRAAFVALEARMGGLVRANIRRVLRDAGRSDTATQEYFAELRRDMLSFDPTRDSAETWLLRRAYVQATAENAQTPPKRDLRAVSGAGFESAASGF